MWKYVFHDWQKEAAEHGWRATDMDRAIQITKIILLLMLVLLFVSYVASQFHIHQPFRSQENIATEPTSEKSGQPLFNNEEEMIERIQQVVMKGGDLNRGLDEKGQTLLHIAASSGYNKAVKLLIENGANLNAVDADGMRPVERAFLESQTETWLLLEDYGDRIKSTN